MRGGLGALGKLGWLGLEPLKHLKIKLWRDLGAGLGEFCKAFRQTWRILDASGVCFGSVLERRGASGRRLGAILGRLGRVLEDSWGVLEASWEPFGNFLKGFSVTLSSV